MELLDSFRTIKVWEMCQKFENYLRFAIIGLIHESWKLDVTYP